MFDITFAEAEPYIVIGTTIYCISVISYLSKDMVNLHKKIDRIDRLITKIYDNTQKYR